MEFNLKILTLQTKIENNKKGMAKISDIVDYRVCNAGFRHQRHAVVAHMDFMPLAVLSLPLFLLLRDYDRF